MMVEKELDAFRQAMDQLVQDYLDNHEIEPDPTTALKQFVDWLDTRRAYDVKE
jgi:hypothetical protein